MILSLLPYILDILGAGRKNLLLQSRGRDVNQVMKFVITNLVNIRREMMMIGYSMRSQERIPCKAPEKTKFEYSGDLLHVHTTG